MDEIFSGAELRRRRRAARLSQIDLGVMVGTSGDVVCRWELGHNNPQWVFIVRLARVLDCNPNDFQGGADLLTHVRLDDDAA